MNKILVVFLFLSSSVTFAHSRLKSPAPRSNSDGIKMGPCGGLPRSANPTAISGGQNLTVTWEETINHPGRFLISLSLGKDVFQSSPLLEVPDNQGADVPMPHQFSAQVPIPDINCDSCTLQLVQSMEENPQAPTYYYSCADVKIMATGTSQTPTPNSPVPGGHLPPPSDVQSQSVAGAEGLTKAKFGGGCGMVESVKPPKGGAGFLLVLPFLIWMLIRLQISVRPQALKLRHQPRQRK